MSIKRKICNEEGCNQYVWARGKCKYHDSLEHPEKYRLNKSSALSSGSGEKSSKKHRPVAKKRISPVSVKQAERLKKYRVVRDEYFKENPVCERCGSSNNLTLHHKAGKIGDLLWNKDYFCSLCISCHRWVEDNPAESKELGFSVDRLDK